MGWLTKEKSGESALDEALAWDTIRPAGYKSKRDFQQWLPVLRESHQARIETNPDFIYLHNQKELMTELRQRTDITLNEKQRKQEREDNKKQRLDIENKRRKAKGMELLTELKSDDDSEEKSSDKKKDAEKKESKNLTDSKNSNTEGKSSVEVDKETEEEKEPDALLLETGNILVDLMSLGKKPVTEQQQAQK